MITPSMTETTAPSRARLNAVALLALLAALPLGGCVIAAVGAVSSAGYVATQERSAGTVLDDAGIRAGIAARLLDRSGQLYASISTEVVQGRVLLIPEEWARRENPGRNDVYDAIRKRALEMRESPNEKLSD